ncbi:MAG: GNAT family N-acetyltransferase [Gammaproteobacteria bacterium]|nr:GNAT family N-acetyltransferase [Gammaproteobacteria bacterium]
MEIRAAETSEAERLSDLAQRSKAHWGYSDAFMEACRDELTYTPEQLAAGGFRVLEDDGEVRGFYALTKVSPDALELEAMFVEPEHIGRGYGRALMDHALAEFEATELSRLIIQADPNAAPFYEHAGALLIGERASASIEGRSLPLYEINLDRKE